MHICMLCTSNYFHANCVIIYIQHVPSSDNKVQQHISISTTGAIAIQSGTTRTYPTGAFLSSMKIKATVMYKRLSQGSIGHMLHHTTPSHAIRQKCGYNIYIGFMYNVHNSPMSSYSTQLSAKSSVKSNFYIFPTRRWNVVCDKKPLDSHYTMPRHTRPRYTMLRYSMSLYAMVRQTKSVHYHKVYWFKCTLNTLVPRCPTVRYATR